jgi:hypothetical protein
MLPNFMVIGAAKCGTTSICELLASHPDVFFSYPKEPYYFCRRNGYEDPAVRTWYESIFSGAGDCRAVGEGSTAYTHPNACRRTAARIAAVLPDCKFIFMARHPLKRLESDWKMRRHEGWAAESINDAVREAPTLVTHGFYWNNICAYLDLFPSEQLIIVFLEEFAADPARELRRCFRHLGVDDSIDVGEIETPRNSSSQYFRDTKLLAVLRRLPMTTRARSYLPEAWTARAKSMLLVPERFPVKWDPALKAELNARFEEASTAFLEFCGKPLDFWDFQA